MKKLINVAALLFSAAILFTACSDGSSDSSESSSNSVSELRSKYKVELFSDSEVPLECEKEKYDAVNDEGTALVEKERYKTFTLSDGTWKFSQLLDGSGTLQTFTVADGKITSIADAFSVKTRNLNDSDVKMVKEKGMDYINMLYFISTPIDYYLDGNKLVVILKASSVFREGPANIICYDVISEFIDEKTNSDNTKYKLVNENGKVWYFQKQ